MTRHPKPQEAVDAWNAKHRPGISVAVIKDSATGDAIITETTSEAWVMGGHTAVIMLADISGCYMLDRVKPVTQPLTRMQTAD